VTADAVPQKPDPGSDAALSAGCLCPVFDNNFGTAAPVPPDGWLIVPGCPVHAPAQPRVRRIEAA
jgi:hypothetical protein